MINKFKTSAVFALLCSSLCFAEHAIPNPLIDAKSFLRIARESQEPREKTRLTEAAFLAAMQSGEYILLDARSAQNYSLRHIKGAVNLPFTEFTSAALAKVIPTLETKILIYCNNNFIGSPDAFASKAPAAALNLSTQVALRTYGYTKLFELAPLLNVDQTLLPFDGTEIR